MYHSARVKGGRGGSKVKEGKPHARVSPRLGKMYRHHARGEGGGAEHFMRSHTVTQIGELMER